MTFMTSLQNFISETESDVLKVIAAIKADAVVVQNDINSALHWIASNTPAIASDIEEVVGIAQAVGVAGNPEVAAAVTAANVAVTALNAFAASSNSGASNTQAVIAGYTAVKQAQAASASAAAAMAASTAPAAAKAAATTAAVAG